MQRKEILVQKRNYILDTSPELTQKIRLVEKYRPDGTVNPAYPSRLLPYGQMPKSLFLIGEFPDPSGKTAAIVGARSCSAYGKAEARRFAVELASSGVQIISGMASGIDAWAQKGALDVRGRTFSVLGCGVNVCYPRENYSLYREIAEGHGGLISEFAPDALPISWHFPIRNRIISALADIVLVVEARLKSGSLITADYALDQGKTVYAVPGRNDDPLSQGCNRLIAQGAGIATSPEVLLEELGLAAPESKKREKQERQLPPEWKKSEEFRKIFTGLNSREISLADLQEKTGIEMPQLCQVLMQLCMSGYAEEASPGYYRKTY